MRRLCKFAASAWLPALLVGVIDAVPAPVQLKLVTPAVYLPQVPVLVRVEAHDARGRRDWSLWNAEATLSVNQPGVTLSTNRVRLYNGLGSIQVMFGGGGDFDLTATMEELQASRSIQSVAGSSPASVSGTLPGTETTWSGVINVTADLTVPAGHTLTIESNTLVLVNGVASGTAGPDIIVNGTIRSLGTEEHPVTITCVSAALRFGEVRHANAQPSIYRHTSISRGGRSPGTGHTSSFGGPLFRLTGSTVAFETCNLTDNAGKLMNAANSELVFDNCLLARGIMGPEINGTGLLCTNTYIMEMSSADDGDGIYLHNAGARSMKLTYCVIAGLTGSADDGIDTLDARVTIEDCIIRDWFHLNPAEDPKGISAFNEEVILRRCLIVDNFIGLNAKAYAPPNFARVIIEQCTIDGISSAVSAGIKANAPGPAIDIRITNSILRSVDAVRSDFDPVTLTNFMIGYCNVSEAVAGTGNFNADPMFADVDGRDFQLRPYSPCIDSGNPASGFDPDGSPADVGVYTFVPPPAGLSAPRMMGGNLFEFTLDAYTNRNYVIEFSESGAGWNDLKTVFQSSGTNPVSDSVSAGSTDRIYRARLAP
jgi:hypothetical protein